MLFYFLVSFLMATVSFPENISGFPKVRKNPTWTKLGNSTRSQRYLFPFAVVSFPPEPCSPTNTQQLEGVCLSKKRCGAYGGDSVGSCQQGLGTCCKFTKQCFSNRRSVQVLETVENLMSSNMPGSCEFIFPRQQGICQIKLDFVNVALQEPSVIGRNAGNCQSESLTVSGAANLNGPLKVCGRLTGQHMIMSYGSTSDMVSMVLHSELSTANYHIRATQIPCNSLNKAPDDCFQYYTTTTAAVKSFGFPRQLNSQKYTICVKPNSGGSTLSWDICQDNDSDGAPFANRFNVSQQVAPCITDWIAIDSEKRCGQVFTPLQTNIGSHGRIRVNFDETETGNDVFYPVLPVMPGGDPPEMVCAQFLIPTQFQGFPTPTPPTPDLCTYTNSVCECAFSNLPDARTQSLVIMASNSPPQNYLCPVIPGYTPSPERLVNAGDQCRYFSNLRITDKANTGFCLRYQAM